MREEEEKKKREEKEGKVDIIEPYLSLISVSRKCESMYLHQMNKQNILHQ